MKNIFLSKSELSLDAAEKLKNNPHNHYSPSIHCSYYSCYQKLLHVLFKILGYSKEQYDNEFRLFRLKQEAGNHEFMLQLFWRKISAKNIDDGRDFKNNFISLRKLRIDSDYLEIWIEKDKSDLAYHLAEAIHKNLRRNF